MFQALGNTVPSLVSSGSRLVTFVLPALWLARRPGVELHDFWYLSVASVALQALTSLLLLRMGDAPATSGGCLNMRVLEAARIEIRRLLPDDAAFMLELLNDPSFIRNIGDRGVRDLEGARGYIMRSAVASHEKHGYGLDLVELKATPPEPAGICGLVRRTTWMTRTSALRSCLNSLGLVTRSRPRRPSSSTRAGC